MENENKTAIKQKTFKEYIKTSKLWKPLLGILIGGIAGYLYYHFIGCTSGTCAITSNPVKSTMMGSFLGLFISSNPCSRGKC